MPTYLEPWEGKFSPEAEKYPLVMVDPHMRFSFHTHHDNKSPWLDEIPAHRILKDGYAYWPIRINHEDATSARHQARRHRQALQRSRRDSRRGMVDRKSQEGNDFGVPGWGEVRSARARETGKHRPRGMHEPADTIKICVEERSGHGLQLILCRN